MTASPSELRSGVNRPAGSRREGPVEDEGAADGLGYASVGRSGGDGLGRPVDVEGCVLQHLDLEELVGVEGFLDACQNGVGKTIGADEEEWFEVVGEGAQLCPLS